MEKDRQFAVAENLTATPTSSKRIEEQEQNDVETFVIEAKNELEDEALGLILDFDVNNPMVAEPVETASEEKPAKRSKTKGKQK